MQNKKLVVEFLVSLKVFPIDFPKTVLHFRDILQDVSSFCCGLDVVTSLVLTLFGWIRIFHA